MSTTAASEDISKSAPAIADLYQRWTLDLIPRLGPYCGTVFETYPHKFKSVPTPIVRELSAIKYRAGNDEYYLTDGQRSIVLTAILGQSDGSMESPDSSSFHQASEAVRRAAVAFVERSFDTGERQLRDSFRDSISGLREYVTSMEGAVVEAALTRTDKQFASVVKVLQSKEFAAGFGLGPAPSGGSWPLELEVSGDGATLVQTLTTAMNSSATETGDHFLTLQRIAHFGARTISEAAAGRVDAEDDRADEAIGFAYRWWTALEGLSLQGSAGRIV